MKWDQYAFLALLPLCVFGLGYSWVWWFKTGRRQPGKRTARAVLALVYNTVLPLLLMAFLPLCFVPRSYALIGLPFAAIGIGLAFRGQGKLRSLLGTCAVGSYLIFAVSIPVSRPAVKSGRNQAEVQHTGCQAGGQ